MIMCLVGKKKRKWMRKDWQKGIKGRFVISLNKVSVPIPWNNRTAGGLLWAGGQRRRAWNTLILSTKAAVCHWICSATPSHLASPPTGAHCESPKHQISAINLSLAQGKRALRFLGSIKKEHKEKVSVTCVVQKHLIRTNIHKAPQTTLVKGINFVCSI